MSLSVDYIGRVSDIDMFGTSDNITSEDVTLTFGSGAVVAGPYKEAQKFLRILLSDPNNLIGQPKYGTGLFTKLSQGGISNEAQFRMYFAISKSQAVDFLRLAKLKNGVRDTRFLDDEVLRDVTIQSLSVVPGTFKLTLKFTFADDDANIIIPVGLSVNT